MEKKFPVIDVEKTGWNIKWIMSQEGITVKDVQRYLKLGTPQSVYHWLDGRNLPTIDNLYALSGLFQVPMDKILVGTKTVIEDTNISMGYMLHDQKNNIIVECVGDQDNKRAALFRMMSYYNMLRRMKYEKKKGQH